MKRFLTQFNQGQPRNLADLRWMTQGLYESSLGLASAVCPPNDVVILSGCVRSVVGSTASISAGWVTKGGEIFRVAAHSFSTLAIGTEYWAFDTVFDPVGLKAYNSVGVTHDTYQEQVYKVVLAAPPVGSTTYANTKKYMDLVTSSLVMDPWQEFKSQTWGIGSFFGVATFKLYCMHDLNGFVHIQGDFGFEDPGGGAVDDVIAILPVGYRPTMKRQALLSTQSNSSTGEIGHLLMTIETNGEIRMKSAFIGYAGIMDFSQIQPFMRSV